jgi:probable phosphoglycerate mutase
MQLVLVRHGETEWTERGLLHGRLDSPLSAAGRRHAELTAQRLRSERFDALFSSPKGRALQTAAIIGAALGLTPTPLDELREADFGWLEGRPLAQIDPDGPGNPLRRPVVWLARRLSAEPLPRVARRVAAAADHITRRYPQGRVLAVTHWGILSMLLAQLVDRDPGRWQGRGPWAACGISELRAVNGAWEVVRLNDRTHIRDDDSSQPGFRPRQDSGHG